MRVAVYARVSLDKDGTARTIGRQLASCWQYVENCGYEVAGEFVDCNASAYNRRKDRPRFEQMRKGLRVGSFDTSSYIQIDLGREPMIHQVGGFGG
jgi:DNA invertase Pin-like site-specific DNA recombinase